MMAFDLYGSAAPFAAEMSDPVSTNLDTLAAARWVQISDDRWRLHWEDCCDYLDPCAEDSENHFVCELHSEDGDWIYDWWHSIRGGRQERNDLGFVGPRIEDALNKLRALMVVEMDQWIESCEEAMAARDDDEGD